MHSICLHTVSIEKSLEERTCLSVVEGQEELLVSKWSGPRALTFLLHCLGIVTLISDALQLPGLENLNSGQLWVMEIWVLVFSAHQIDSFS